ncbi:YbjN domain-containing protein [Micromonospora craniellae]|uniref:YbjN domain-containing protein n=2 Tax=Micromonospora craniellae TaxID=2294034 RepID=A0A372G5D1_9ACTN|nr:YbjN domain-containing protein [Micromonospora craniellae]QOC94859.1 YbjN domain-containing protein [Micromonospora craniellae]RFS47930.1 YbjN domain-containing protein [Micromonospora craniellae]
MPDGEPRITELERVAALAEATGDTATARSAWSELVETHLRGGERWRLFEPVRRCLAAARARPTPGGPDDETLRRYRRYAVEALLGTPRIGLDQAADLLDTRTEVGVKAAVGDGADAVVAQVRCRIADHLGDEPAARHWLRRWQAVPADPAAGCPDCLPVRQAELLAGWGDWTEACAVVASVLDGPDGCTAQPEAALTGALLPWLRAGETHRAARAHVRAYRRHRVEPDGFGHLATHLRFCALGGHLGRGLAILVEQLPRLDQPHDDRSVMEFATAGALVCACADADRTVLRPAYRGRPAAQVTVSALGAELLAVATALAGSFDARNGTGHQSGRIAAWLAERPLAEPVPLPAEDEIEPDDEPWPGDAATTGSEDGGTGAEVTAGGGVDRSADEIGALTVTMITEALDRRGDGYTLDPTGTVLGRWGDAVIQFRRTGEHGEILHARVVAGRRLPAARRAEAYAFCNGWNRDRLLPTAYVHDPGVGELVLAGEVTTDLAYGVAPAQVTVLVDAAVRTGVAYAEAVAALP